MSRYFSEKSLTSKQNKIIYEEVYFYDTANVNTIDISTGYCFKYPQLFSSNPSMDKSIAPRRVKLIPKSYSFNIAIGFKLANNSYDALNYIHFDFTSENSMIEILNTMCSALEYQTDDYTFNLSNDYNPSTGMLKFTANAKVGDGVLPCSFRFICQDEENWRALWNCLNQPNDPFMDVYDREIIDEEEDEGHIFTKDHMKYVSSYTLFNVWSRKQLFFHASFSNSSHHYVCLSDDSWEKPSKIYKDNVLGSEFFVFFTTDVIHKIIPYSSTVLIELSFILRTDKLS